jgi:hypothetical protein
MGTDQVTVWPNESRYESAVAQLSAKGADFQGLRDSASAVMVIWICEPAVAQSGPLSLIMNALQLIDWPKSRFQYANRR